MTKTATEQAIASVERGLTVAKRDNTMFSSRNVKISPKGYFSINGQRCSQAHAVQALAHFLNEEAKAETEALSKAKPGQRVRVAGPMAYESLNQATRDFFFELAELIQEATKDADNRTPARLGAEIPKIAPRNQPRLTNLKKAGVVMSGNLDNQPKSHKFIWLTEQGHAIWAAQV